MEVQVTPACVTPHNVMPIIGADPSIPVESAKESNVCSKSIICNL